MDEEGRRTLKLEGSPKSSSLSEVPDKKPVSEQGARAGW